MRNRRKWLVLLAAMASLSLVAAACSDDGGGSTGGSGSTAQDLTGAIAVSGSSTVLPISSLVAELFNEVQPGVAISVDGPEIGRAHV